MFLSSPIENSSITKIFKKYKSRLKKQQKQVWKKWQSLFRNLQKQRRKFRRSFLFKQKSLQLYQSQLATNWRAYLRDSQQRGAIFYLNLAKLQRKKCRLVKKFLQQRLGQLSAYKANFSVLIKNYQLRLKQKRGACAGQIQRQRSKIIKRYSNSLKYIAKYKKQLVGNWQKKSSSKVWQIWHGLLTRIGLFKTNAILKAQSVAKIISLLPQLLVRQLVKIAQWLWRNLAWNSHTTDRRLFYAITLSYGILGVCWQVYVVAFADLPSPLELTHKDQIVSTRILDRNGQLLYRIYEDENRTLIPLSQVPTHVIQATVAIEDRDFWQHHGFSIKGIFRALLRNIESEGVSQGGSTITQQLVKNRLLSSEKTYKRKIREVLLAILVEGTYSKEEILEMYLNQVPYGGATYGIEEASWRYFNKSARDLTLAEGALLAGLPAAPSIYSPFGPNPELAYNRRQEVLRRMVEDGYITEAVRQASQNQSLNFRMDTIDIKAPHFVMYVKKLLAEQFGEDLISTGGLEVRTTLDLALQNEAQRLVTEEVNSLARLRVQNGAALVSNPQTGEILAMVGSKNYFDFEHDGQVNVAIRPRQPGSSIKPLTYAIAFEQGQSPSTMVDDAPIVYHIPGSKPYAPKNYDGKFRGKVSLRQALGSSYNIPAVKTLASIGINTMLDKADAIGISTWQDRKRFGLSLTLGGGEVLMTDMAKLYGTFATMGYTVDLNPLLEVRNYKGEILYRNRCALENICERQQNFSAKTAYQISNILADNNARTPAFGPRSVLYIPNQEVAVKTGTTNNLRDNWTIGYTSDRLVATWVGNNDSTSMSYVASGITGASPIWNKIMLLLLDENQPHRFAVPDGLIKVKICAQTGTLPCLGCPTIVEELYLAGQEPRQACNPAFFKPKPTLQPGESRDQILEGAQTGW